MSATTSEVLHDTRSSSPDIDALGLFIINGGHSCLLPA